MTVTTMTDRYGLPVSTGSARALAWYDDGVERVLAYGVAPSAAFQRAIDEDENFAMAHAALAMSRLRELRLPEARASAERAVALADGLPRRERQHVQATADAVSGRGMKALALMREHLAEYPLDALILNATIGSLLYAGHQQEMLHLSQAARPAYPADDWFSLGVYAFGLEESRRYGEARLAAEAALAAHAPAAFASHALSHVFYELGEDSAGLDFLSGWFAGYDRRAGLHLHLGWHLGLFYLARGEYARVLDLYEREIRPAARPAEFQLFDPVSLLWRLSAYACPVGDRFWDEVGRVAEARAAAPSTVFNDLHHGMALSRAGDQQALNGLLDSFRARGARGNATAGEVALPLLQGMRAFAEGDYPTTIACIEPIEERIYEIGGSKAQREVFHDTLLEALLRAGRFDEAELRLRRRLDARASPRDFYRLGTAQAGSGRHAEANESHAEARGRWPYLDETAPEAARLRRSDTTAGGRLSGAADG